MWDQPAFVHRDAQIESLKKEVETLRAEMEKIKLEVKPGWGGRMGWGLVLFAVETLKGCGRSGVLASSVVFWDLSQCQDVIPAGVGACETCPLLSLCYQQGQSDCRGRGESFPAHPPGWLGCSAQIAAPGWGCWGGQGRAPMPRDPHRHSVTSPSSRPR